MNVCIINCGKDSGSTRLVEISKALSRGLEGQGHSVTVLNAYTDTDQRLSYYDYLIIGVESMGLLSAKVPEVLSNYLRVVPGAGGKRCLAFNTKSLRASKQLINAMKVLEREGLFLHNSTTFKNANEAEALAKRINIKRS